MPTQIEIDTYQYIQMIPKRLDGVAKQLSRIADVLEKMERKDGPTIKDLVDKAFNKE